MRGQAIRFGADLQMEDVESVSLVGPVKEVVTAGGETHRARTVIPAMGAAARYLGVPGEQELLGRGVSSCATCDGFFFKNQDIAMIGGGDSAMEEATFLTRFARSVTLVRRRTAKPSPPRAAAARRPSKPNAGWPTPTTAAPLR